MASRPESEKEKVRGYSKATIKQMNEKMSGKGERWMHDCQCYEEEEDYVYVACMKRFNHEPRGSYRIAIIDTKKNQIIDYTLIPYECMPMEMRWNQKTKEVEVDAVVEKDIKTNMMLTFKRMEIDGKMTLQFKEKKKPILTYAEYVKRSGF